MASLDNPLLRHAAKDHFFRAVVCRIALDNQDGENAMTKYSEKCPSFHDSRESKLLKVVIGRCIGLCLHKVLGASAFLKALYFFLCYSIFLKLHCYSLKVKLLLIVSVLSIIYPCVS